MPGKFLGGTSKSSKSGNNRMLVIIVVVLGAVLIAGGIFLYFRMQNKATNATNTVVNTNRVTNTNTTNANTNSNANANTNASNANTNSNANVNTNTGVSTIVKGSLTDPLTNKVLGEATLTIPPLALPSTVKTVAMTTLAPGIGAYKTSKNYQAIGGVYIITPSSTSLAKKATLEMTYTDSEILGLDFAAKKDTITAASWDGTDWKPMNSLVDQNKNLVTVEISEFYADGIALVVPRPAATNTNTVNINDAVVPSLDSDQDGLTNQEEILYGTNAGSADTDLDGYKDGQEVLAFYNPNGQGKLIDSALVKTYENTTYRYSMLAPPSWTVGTLNADKLVTFTSVTGEFVQVSVQENTSGLSAREWYISLNPSVKQSSLKDIAVGTVTGVLGPDGLNAYLADKKYIYQVTYNIGVKKEANYLTTFSMMYTSVKTNIPVAATNTNTAANANANTNAANTNAANTNANTNAAVNTNTNTNSAANVSS